MSKAGQSNISGINYQAKSALLLFLLRLEEGNFDSITLEDDNWEDFTLNYLSGKKIICESKNYTSRAVGKTLVKSILTNIQNRESTINKDDEVLIICPTVTAELSGNLQYIAWFPETKKHYQDLGFTDAQISLLAKTSFYNATDEFLYQELLTYFYAKIGYWLPEEEVVGLLNTVLVDQIYSKSAKGMTFTRGDLLKSIDDYKNKKIKQNGVYDAEQTEIKKQIHTVLADVRNKRSVELKRDLTALTAQPQHMFIVLNTVFELKDVKLAEWDFLWAPLLDRQYAFTIVHNFEKYTDDIENSKYIVKLFTDQVLSLTNKATDRFHSEYALQLVEKILKKHPSLSSDIFELVQKYFSSKHANYFELEGRSDSSQERAVLSTVLANLFEKFSDDSVKQQEIIELVKSNFNLVEDDGDYSLFTPSPIFGILNQYIQKDFEVNFKKVINILIDQFKNAKYYGSKFSGWELTGGTFSQSGNNYSVTDRHFILHALGPSLIAYHKNNPAKTWAYITENCIARKKNEVSEQKPDFLGRAAIPLLVSEFNNGENSKKALAILKDQMFMRRGIPSKFELIFQELYKDETVSDDKKWVLTEAFLKKFKLPMSVFVEQVTSDLAMKGNEGALDAIKAWVNNPEYREQQTRHTFFVSQSMFKLLNTDAGSKTFLAGVEILKSYVSTDDFKQKLDSFHAYDITGAISRLIEKDFDTGIGLVRDIYDSSKRLTINQQLAVTHSLEQLNKEDEQLIKKAYDVLVKPILVDELKSDNELIEKRFTHNYARELFVQFTEHLAELKLFDEALVLARIFTNDSNPTLENEPTDKDGTFNYHARIVAGEDGITINTVRGWTAWVLQKYSVVKGRDYLPEITNLVEKLTKDPNYYVRTQSTFALSALVKNRHTYMPGTDNTERFINLELAQKMEDICFAMIRDKDNVDNPVIMKYVLQVFGALRTLREDEALEMFDAFNVKTFNKHLDDIYSLVPQYALFRKDYFKDPSFKNLFGEELFDKINNFDDTKFKVLLEKLIREGDDEMRTHIGWYFWTLPKNNPQDLEEMFNLSYKYLTIMAERYSREAFSRIGYFIHENINAKPRECLELWQEVTKKEQAWLSKNSGTMKPHEWWSHHHNAEFLAKTREFYDDEKYMDMLETLLSYPEGFSPMIGHEENYSILTEINSDRSKAVLENLKKQYPTLYAKDTHGES